MLGVQPAPFLLDPRHKETWFIKGHNPFPHRRCCACNGPLRDNSFRRFACGAAWTAGIPHDDRVSPFMFEAECWVEDPTIRRHTEMC